MVLQDTIYGRLSQLKGDMSALTNAAGNEVGIKGDLMTRVGTIESNLNPTAKAKSSSATGLFQFTKPTWDAMVAAHGAEMGLPQGASRKDPVANSLMAAKYMAQNAESFKKKFGRDATDVEIYMGHFLGPSGRDGFISALAKNPNAPVTQHVSTAALKSNKNVFFDNGRARSLQEVFDMYGNKMGIESKSQGEVPMVDKTHAPDVPDSKTALEQVGEQALTHEAILESIQSNQTMAGGFQPTSKGAPLGGSLDNPSAFAPMSNAYESQEVPDDRPWFDGAWDVTKAEATLSPIGRWLDSQDEKAVTLMTALSGVDGPSAQFLEAFGIDNEFQDYLKGGSTGPVPEFDEAMYSRLREQGLDDKWFDYVKVAPSYPALEKRLANALDMQKADKTRKDAPMSSQIVGGLAGALGDPLTFIGGAGGNLVGKLPRMFVAGAEAAAANVVYEGVLQAETKGAIEGEFANAAIGGFLLGSSIRGVGDLIGGASNRAMARQEAIDAGVDDPTLRPDLAKADEIVPHPDEVGAVVLPDGQVVSGTNPLNPLHRKANEVPIISNILPLLSNKVLNATSPAVRDIGMGLVRPAGAFEGGGVGKAGMVAEDISSMLQGRDFERAVRLDSALRDAYESGFFGVSKDVEGTHRAIIEALESRSLDGITDAQKKVIEIIQENMNLKFDMATSPQQFGNVDAPPVFNSRRDADSYFPASYDVGKRAALIEKYGSAENLQEVMRANLREQWDNNVDGVRERYKEQYSEEFSAALKEATDEAQAKSAKLAEVEPKLQAELTAVTSKLEKSKKAMEMNLEKQRKARRPDTRKRYADMAAKHRSFVQEHQARIDEIDAQLRGPEIDQEAILDRLVDEMIESKTYGIARADEFTYSSVLEDARANESLVGIENNNFTKERNIFSMGYRSLAADGSEFALNDMRYMNIPDMMNLYNRRINGDIAIHGSTGKSTKDLKDEIIAIADDDAGKQALSELVKVITGKSRKPTPTGAMDMLGQSVLDLGFFARGAKFWLNQAAEISGVVGHRAAQAVRGGVPALNNLTNPQTKWDAKALKRLELDMFGLEVNRVMQGSFQGYKDTLARSGVGEKTANVVAGVRIGTQSLAQGRYNPWTRLFGKVTNGMVSMARSGVLSDLTEEAFTGVTKFTPEMRKLASITEEQHKGIIDMLKQHIKIVDGKYTADNAALIKDPRALDLWRLSDYTASQAITRVNKAGSEYLGHQGLFGQLALQFKSFMFKGMQGRTLRLLAAAGNGNKMDTAFSALASIATGAALYSGNTILNSSAMNENERERYLTKQFDPLTFGYQAVSRSADFGPVLGAVNLLGSMTGNDIFTAGRSTLQPKTPTVKESLASGAVGLKERKANIAGIATDIIPTVGTVAAVTGLGAEAYGKATAEYGFEQSNYNRSFYEHLRNVLPNDPITQAVIHELAMMDGYSQYQQ